MSDGRAREIERARRVPAVGLAALLVALAGRAEAQPLAPASAPPAPPAPAGPPPSLDGGRVDPLLVTGISMAGLGSVGFFGVPMVLDSHWEKAIPGWGLIGAGVGMGIVAVPTILVGALSPIPRTGVRRRDGMVTAGIWTTGVGASLVGLFIADTQAAGALAGGPRRNAPVSLPFGVVGGAAFLVGAPLLIVGASTSPAPSDGPRHLRSPARMYTGIILSTVGVGLVSGGAYASMWLGTANSSMDAMVTAFPTILGGTCLLAAGIALWAIGSKVEGPSPQLSFGPGSLHLRGTF